MIRRAPGAPRGALSLMVVGALTLTGCATASLDTSPTTAPQAAPATPAPVAADAPLPELFAQLDELMRGLDELIVEDEGDEAALVRIEAVWDVTEQRIRERDPDDLYPFEQAISLVRTGVERRRPADASKGYKLLVTAIDTYDLEP